jgi:High potential iron-sulfur protein
MLFDKGPTMTHAIEKLPKLTRRTLLQVGAGAVSILGLSTRSTKAAKVSKAAVAYQDSPKGDQNCANCRLFIAPNACKQVEGDISPNGWCRIWAKAA